MQVVNQNKVKVINNSICESGMSDNVDCYSNMKRYDSQWGAGLCATDSLKNSSCVSQTVSSLARSWIWLLPSSIIQWMSILEVSGEKVI
jgi:hypothetical protein